MYLARNIGFLKTDRLLQKSNSFRLILSEHAKNHQAISSENFKSVFFAKYLWIDRKSSKTVISLARIQDRQESESELLLHNEKGTVKRANSVFSCRLSTHCLYKSLNYSIIWLLKDKENVSDPNFSARINWNRISMDSMIFKATMAEWLSRSARTTKVMFEPWHH